MEDKLKKYCLALDLKDEKEKIDAFPEKVVAASAQVPLSISLI